MADVINDGKRKTEDLEDTPATKKAKDSEVEVKVENGVDNLPTLDLPDEDTLNTMPEESMKKTIEKLAKGKVAADKYVESLTIAHDTVAERKPDFLSEEQKISFLALKNFKEQMADKKVNAKIEDDTKKAFAYHIEVCKAAMSELFTAVAEVKEAEEKPAVTETPIEAVFKHAPSLAMDSVYEVVNTGLTKLVRAGEKKQLLEDLKQLYEKMQIADESLSHQILESIGKDAVGCWRFLHQHAEEIFELYTKLGKTELVILSVCRDVVATVLEKMILCRKNWGVAAQTLNRYPMGATSLVGGPVVTSEVFGNTSSLMGLIPDSCFTGHDSLQHLLGDLKRKVDSSDKKIIDHEKTLFPEGGEESFNFILNDLPSKLVGSQNRFLSVEEKLYIGYHYSVIKNCIYKMMELSIARKVLDGKYIFRKDAKSGDGRRDGRKDRNRNGFGGRGISNGRQFNHRGMY